MAYLDEVDDAVVTAYVKRLVKEGKAPTTIEGRFVALMSLLRRNGVTRSLKVSKAHIPKINERMPRVYSEATLKRLFAAANGEERMLFEFFLGLGMREREVMHAAYGDIDWTRQTYRVSEKPDVPFFLKNHKERIVTVPTALLAALKARHKQNPRARWIFPTKAGRPNGHLLRTLQELAFKAGMNCGKCRTKGGKLCAETACCREFNLHDFRRTFATSHHRAGVSPRDLMAMLGHQDLKTTLRYLSAEEAGSGAAIKMVDKTWLAFASTPAAS